MTAIRSRPDNVLVEGNRSTVPPYPSSFLIHHRAIPWHTLATYQWGALPSSRGDVFAAIFSLLRIQSPTRQRSRGRSSCGRHSIHRANSETWPWTHKGQRRDIVSGQEICSGKWPTDREVNSNLIQPTQDKADLILVPGSQVANPFQCITCRCTLDA